MEELRFAYQVNPKKPIRTLPQFGLLRANKTLMMTKEEVKEALKSASVYRRFDHENVVRVSIYNLDRLHNEKFMDEKEYENFINPAPISVEEERLPVIEETENLALNEDLKDDSVDNAETSENVENEAEPVSNDTISDEITEENNTNIEAEEKTEETSEENNEYVPDENTTIADQNDEPNVVVTSNNKTTVNYNKKKHHH